MSKSKIPAVVAVLLLVIIILTIVKNLNNGDRSLISPAFWQKTDQSAATPNPTPSYNPPQEIKYDSSTDLRRELDSVNPEVLDNDFGT